MLFFNTCLVLKGTMTKQFFFIFYCNGLICHQWLDFRLACSVPPAWLQRAQAVQNSFSGCSGHIESMQYICDGKVTVWKIPKLAGKVWKVTV